MFNLIIILVVVGVLLYLVNEITMDAKIKRIINAVVILCVVLWLLEAFGILQLANIPVPQLGHRR